MVTPPTPTTVIQSIQGIKNIYIYIYISIFEKYIYFRCHHIWEKTQYNENEQIQIELGAVQQMETSNSESLIKRFK